tara:strand:+ start:597 stop:752 length:156 start_codon:yes stop_codon:yes gene_type:complete
MKKITKPVHLMSVCEMIEAGIPLLCNRSIDVLLGPEKENEKPKKKTTKPKK